MVTERAKKHNGGDGARGERHPLAFIDHQRQDYAEHVPVSGEGEFLIGDYLKDGGVGERGGFRVALHWLGSRHGLLDPQLCVLGDGAGALEELLGLLGGLTGLLEPVADHGEFSRRLLELGLRDASNKPLEEDR
ncbi:MAG TPA: hypothetical protein VG518_05660 [Solirubrobacterales bacterium]|nr:hypothetical protein [Solirubrobacterales bacterium]